MGVGTGGMDFLIWHFPDAHERSMLFLPPGIVYWLQASLHWCDNNAVFIDDVSKVYANSFPQKTGKKQNKSVHAHCISENFQSGVRTKG